MRSLRTQRMTHRLSPGYSRLVPCPCHPRLVPAGESMRNLTSISRVGSGVAAVLALTLSLAPQAIASSSPNPVAGKTWGIYEGNGDGLWPAYEQSTGRDHRLLGKMALHARVRWYGQWIETKYIASQITKDITQEQNGNPSVMVWM